MTAVLVLGLAAPQAATAQEPTAIGRDGGAATVDATGTQAAISALRQGGNAVDAAVAAAAVLGVTEPYSCGIGGGGFMVIRTPDGKVTTIDSREESPAAMRPDSFFVDGEAPDPTDDADFASARYSGLSAGVPGTVAGWDKALRRYGSWSLKRALRSGVQVARRGFEVDETFVSQTEPNVEYFDDIPSTAAIYLDPDGTPRDEGSTLRNRDLARTYELIGKQGKRGFYRGDLAEAMADAAQSPPVAPDADHEWRPGLMTEADVKSYEALKRAPTRIGYRGLDVWSMAPPSSGGSTVGEALNILEGYDLSAADRTRALHLYLEASRLSYADRSAFIADPEFFDVPLAGLLSDEYAAERRALIDPEQAGTSPVEAGDPRPYSSTTHLVVSDRKGTVVSYTFTIESTGGNGIVVPGYGFLLNNELTDFNIDATDEPNSPDAEQAPALFDGAHDRYQERQAIPRRRLARRLDDHHNRAAGAARAPRPGRHPARGDRGAARQPAQHRDHRSRAGLHRLARGPGPGLVLRPRVRGARLRGDRGGDRARVPRPRAGARRGRARAAGRRQRRGRAAVDS